MGLLEGKQVEVDEREKNEGRTELFMHKLVLLRKEPYLAPHFYRSKPLLRKINIHIDYIKKKDLRHWALLSREKYGKKPE